MRSSVPLWLAFGILIFGAAMSRYTPESSAMPVQQKLKSLVPQVRLNPTPQEPAPRVEAEKPESISDGSNALVLNNDEFEIHKSNWDYLNGFSNRIFAPYDEVIELGLNEDGESEYEFVTGNGEHVQQRFSADGFPVEEVITMNDGSTLTRSYFEGSSKVQVVIYAGTQGYTQGYRRMWYTSNNEFEALETGESPEKTMLYRYNNDGNVREVWENGSSWVRIR
jgi:hypothetical protein